MTTPVTFVGNVATNTETGETYTYGKRGRKPAWIVTYEAEHGLPECVTQKEVVDPASFEVEYDADARVLTNKTLDKTYTFGQKGKRANWVKAWIEANPEAVTPVQVEETVTAE